MSLILHIETATQICSVALAEDGNIVAIRESDEPNRHAASVAVFIDQVITEAGIGFDRISAVAVSQGPGSYTGLRLGVSAAKGLCYALEIPLLAVDSLLSMAAGMILHLKGLPGGLESDPLFCPMIDARRMEVYRAVYDQHLELVDGIKAEIITMDSFKEIPSGRPLWFFGDGAAKCEIILSHLPTARFDLDFKPSARYMTGLALELFRQGRFVDTAYFEPYYLKDFIPGIPRVKGLH